MPRWPRWFTAPQIRIAPYIVARGLHAALAAVFAWVLMGPAQGVFDVGAVPVVAPAWAAQAVGFTNTLFHATAGAAQLGVASLALVAVGVVFRRCALFCDPHSLVAASPLQFAAALLHGAERPFQRLL